MTAASSAANCVAGGVNIFLPRADDRHPLGFLGVFEPGSGFVQGRAGLIESLPADGPLAHQAFGPFEILLATRHGGALLGDLRLGRGDFLGPRAVFQPRASVACALSRRARATRKSSSKYFLSSVAIT